MTKIFIDGSSGTTGLRIRERLSNRDDVDLITLPENIRRDINARQDALNNSDIAFLCLPDKEAIEAVNLIEANNNHTAVIDTSTAHRVDKGWAYGFPELKGQREKIKASKRIANPGCHATGFISLIAPLVEQGVINSSERLSCFSLTGYSGGGKKMIAQYNDQNRDELLKSPALYGLSQEHKHLPEMKIICGLGNAPVFCPVVADYYSGMQVTVPLFNTCVKEIVSAYKNYYPENSGLVKIQSYDKNFVYANELSGRDDLIISVFGNDERVILTARFDNLGKGASGAAVQNMNLLMNADELKGLVF